MVFREKAGTRYISHITPCIGNKATLLAKLFTRATTRRSRDRDVRVDPSADLHTVLERLISKSSDIPELCLVSLFAAGISTWKSLPISLTVTKKETTIITFVKKFLMSLESFSLAAGSSYGVAPPTRRSS